MSVLKTNLDDEVFSRQEKIVARSINHASQLCECLVQLKKLKQEALVVNQYPQGLMDVTTQAQCDALEAYLRKSITMALMNTKVPTLKSLGSSNTESAKEL